MLDTGLKEIKFKTREDYMHVVLRQEIVCGMREEDFIGKKKIFLQVYCEYYGGLRNFLIPCHKTLLSAKRSTMKYWKELNAPYILTDGKWYVLLSVSKLSRIKKVLEEEGWHVVHKFTTSKWHHV